VPPTQPPGSGTVLPANAIVWYGATKCINVPSGPTDGIPAQIWDCNGGPGQKWTFPADGTVRALGECLTVTGGTTDNGTAVRLAGCTGSPWQRFVLRDTHDLVFLLADKCVDVTNGATANGTGLQLWGCNGGVNQKWHLG
jgi:streptogrisin C